MAFSDYLERRINDAILNQLDYQAPPYIYMAAYTSNPADDNTGIEVSGGSYARVDVTTSFPNASGTSGQVLNNVAVTFPMATANWGTVSHAAILDGPRSIAKTFVDANVNTTTDQITASSHGMSTADPVQFSSTGTLPGGLLANKYYFVRAVDANTLSVHPTAADASANTNKVDITSAAGGGTHTVTEGNLLIYGALTASVAINTNDTLQFNASDITSENQ